MGSRNSSCRSSGSKSVVVVVKCIVCGATKEISESVASQSIVMCDRDGNPMLIHKVRKQ